MSSGVHEKHAKEHDMTSNAACLVVVNLHSCLLANLGTFHIKEAGKVSMRALNLMGLELTSHNAKRHEWL